MSKGQAERELDAHINQYSKARAEANAAALVYESGRKSRKREERRENAKMWFQFYKNQWRFYVRGASKTCDLYLQLRQQIEKEK